jgi:antitoxin component YwqK of YwqJK toxin-antitoxin module
MSILKHRALLTSSLAASVLVAACSGSVLDWRNAQISNGKIYAGDENKPFSGKVTNVPLMTIYGAQPGYQKLVGSTGTLLGVLFGSALLCDTKVEDGLPNGDIECKPGQSDVVQLKGHFDKGVMTGDFTMYDRSGKTPTLEAHYKDGQPDGDLKRYNPETGKLIAEEQLSNGLADGKYQEWNPKTGDLLVEAHYSQGALDGDFIKNGLDGKPLMNGNYDHGKFTGTQTTYWGYQGSHEPGFIITAEEQKYENGVLSNPQDHETVSSFVSDVIGCVDQKGYSQSHSLTSAEIPDAIASCKQEVTAKKDAPAAQDVAAQAPSGSDDRSEFPKESNACVDAWDEAFHKANGADSPIRYDQQWEFVDNCRAGKTPQS